MRIAISTDGQYVSQHFGRCPFFTLIDIEKGKTAKKMEVANPGHAPGYIPKFLHEKGVQCIVCGGMGARAQGLFEEMGIEMKMGAEGKVDTIIEKLEKDELKGGESTCAPGAGRGYGIEKNECDHTDE